MLAPGQQLHMCSAAPVDVHALMQVLSYTVHTVK
jgi:hypothetical protein